jgi:glycosyltransferase involved in cell wall biosynthesis
MTFLKFTKENLVSIILPLYNKENTIINSIKSLIYQTYKNIEIIVVDDCSTDSSIELLTSFIKEEKINNISIYNTPTNLGCYYARNLGISKSRGTYIAFQDPDDYSHFSRIEMQMKDIYNFKVVISFCNIYRFNNIHPNIYNLEKFIEVDRKNKNINSFDYRFKLGIVTSIIKKNLFEKYGLYNTERHSQDLEIIERFYCILSNIDPFTLGNFHNFIINNNKNRIFYYNNENVYYVSDIMNETNITNLYNDDKQEIITKWKYNIQILKNFYN